MEKCLSLLWLLACDWCYWTGTTIVHGFNYLWHHLVHRPLLYRICCTCHDPEYAVHLLRWFRISNAFVTVRVSEDGLYVSTKGGGLIHATMPDKLEQVGVATLRVYRLAGQLKYNHPCDIYDPVLPRHADIDTLDQPVNLFNCLYLYRRWHNSKIIELALKNANRYPLCDFAQLVRLFYGVRRASYILSNNCGYADIQWQPTIGELRVAKTNLGNVTRHYPNPATCAAAQIVAVVGESIRRQHLI